MNFRILEEKALKEVGMNKDELGELEKQLPILCRYPDGGGYSYYLIVKTGAGKFTFLPLSGTSLGMELGLAYPTLSDLAKSYGLLEFLPKHMVQVYTGDTITKPYTVAHK
jgi:hypothetical protein